MHIRYGFDIAIDFAQPTTFLTMMDVHSDFRSGVVEETALELEPDHSCRTVCRRLRKRGEALVRPGWHGVAAPSGRLSNRRTCR